MREKKVDLRIKKLNHEGNIEEFDLEIKLKSLKPNQRVIIEELYRSRMPLSTRELAKETNMSWITAKDNLEMLKTSGIVCVAKIGNRKEWDLCKEKKKN